MSIPRIFYGLVFFVLVACRQSQPTTAGNDQLIRTLIDTADDEQQKMPARMAAAQKAYALAQLQHAKPLHLESIRTRGVLYLRMDSADLALASFRQLVQLADSVSDRENLGMGLNNIGLIFSQRSVYDSALVYYERAGKLFRMMGDTLRIMQGDINTGIAYKNIGDYEKAFGITTAAAHMMENMKASAELGTAYNTMGNTMKDVQRPQEALLYHNKAITIRRELKDSAGIASSLNNIGSVYRSTKQYPLALQYYLQSLEIKKKKGSKKSLVTTIDNIAETYLGMEQYAQAAQYEQEALALRNEAEDKEGWMTSANRLAKIYMARKETVKAKELALHIAAIADKPIYLSHQLKNTLLLEEIYSAEKDHSNALLQAKAALRLKDSLFNSDMTAAISTMNARFRTEEQQKEIELAEKNDIIQEQQIKTQRDFMLLMGSIIILLIVITYLLYLSNKLRKRARERTELLMKELNHRVKNNLQIISDIMNLQSSITEDPKERALIEAGKSRVQSISIVHNLLYRQAYTGNIDMNAFITEIAHNIDLAFQQQFQGAATTLAVDNIQIDEDRAIPLGLITNELLTNVYKYTRPAASGQLTVKVQMKREGGKYQLLISDNGLPWDVQAARQKKKGLGLLLVDMLAKQLKATWQSCRENETTIHTISFGKV